MQPSGRWAIDVRGREPVEIPSGEVFMIEVAQGGGGEYCSVDGYELREGLRAWFFDQREWYAKVVPGSD
jgi:hypothetical protein